MSNKKILMIVASVLALCLIMGAFLSCKPAQSAKSEVRITDQAGREVNITAEIGKIVSLWPEATRIIIALNQGDKIVGICSMEKTDPIFTKIFPVLGDLPDLGNMQGGGINIEELISLEPDIIFADANQGDYADEIQKKTGIPVVCVRINPPAEGGEHSLNLIPLIGQILGEEERAEHLKDFLDKKITSITDITSRISDDKKLKGYIAFARDPLTTNGHIDPLQSGGVINVGESNNIWYGVNIEQVIEWNPDIIFVHILNNLMGGMSPEEIMADPKWQEIDAVKDGQVYNVIIGYLGWYPTAMIVNIMQIAKASYPEEFKNLDVEKESNLMFKEMYNVDNFFTELAQEYNIYIP